MADREPIDGTSRPTGEMQPVQPPQAAPHSSHASHDLEVLAAAADRDADPAVRAAAADQAAACGECAALATELRAIIAGLADLPISRPVPRDMRITAEQAARLRPGLWQRLLRPFGPEGLTALRPIAATLTTLGLAGLLLNALPLGLEGGAAMLHTIGSSVSGGASFDGGSPNGAPVPAAAAPSSAAGQEGYVDKGQTASPPATQPNAPGGGNTGTADNAGGRSLASQPSILDQLPKLSPLVWISLALVVTGLGLFAIRFVARRVT